MGAHAGLGKYKACSACNPVDKCQHQPLYTEKDRAYNANVCKFCFEEFIMACQHEPDGNSYHKPMNGDPWICRSGLPSGAYNHIDKCIKCGEFYR